METNLNMQMCLKPINNFGSTTYQNVCNGQLTTVPWGATDWLEGVLLYFFVGVMILFVVVPIILLVYTAFRK